MDKADPTGPAGVEPSAAASERSLQPDSPSSSYQIKLSPGPDTLRRGVNPLGVLDELRELGESTVTTDPRAVPLLDELDPERCYLSWTITVRTDAEPERLRDVFLFVSEDSNVHIESPAGGWDSRAGATQRRSRIPSTLQVSHVRIIT